MPRVPLAFRLIASQPYTSENKILLFKITHDDLEDPIYLSTDPTERLSVDPLSYGTVSNDDTYTFVEMAAILPDDRKGSPPRVSIAMENVDSSYVELARSFLTPARVDMSIVFASDPDLIMKSMTRLWLTKCSYTESSITFDIARFRSESLPAGRRMTKDRFPGLWGIPGA